MKMLLTQCKIEILRVFRNPYYIFWSLFMPIVFYFIFTRVVYLHVPDKALWDAHFLMSMTSFSVMGCGSMKLSIRMVEDRSKGWTTFMRVTSLTVLIYFFAKMIGESMVHVFSILIISLAGGLVNGIELTVFEWISSAFWILLA